MPILAAEPCLYPADLLQLDRDRSEASEWWVLYTRPQCEKALVRKLAAQRVEHYCPLLKKRARSPSGTLRTSYLPLFPGYVFLHGEEQQRYQAMCSGFVLRCLPVAEPQQFHDQLCGVWRLLDSGSVVEPEGHLKAGTAVRVTSGPLKDLRGYVVRRHGEMRFVVQLELLLCGASVVLDNWELEAL